MVTKVRTINFLPDIFQTKTNDQFLSATLDQLIQQPNYQKIQGYIGSKFGYGVNADDVYVAEPNEIRTDYQLEPAVVFTKTNTQTAVDVITYPELLDAIRIQTSKTLNETLLFKNQFYSWDSFVDLDKFVNYTRYYWLPNGPDAVTITNELYPLTSNFRVQSRSTYKFNVDGVDNTMDNPVLTLVRGGTYTFTVNQSTKFYIQTQPGLQGSSIVNSSVPTREIFGLDNNGINRGVMTFNVPQKGEQDQFNIPGFETVDLVTTLDFEQIHGIPLLNLKSIDGVTDLVGKTIMFYKKTPDAKGFASVGYDGIGFDQAANINGYFEAGQYHILNNNFFKITLANNTDIPIIKLVPTGLIPSDEAITVKLGTEYSLRKFVRNYLGEIELLPILTSDIDVLYYQDETSPLKGGKILLVDPSDDEILIDDIIGRVNYTSPNNIKFTNGLKVQFVGNVIPERYRNNQYYVEGVGTSIELIDVRDFITPEPYGVTTTYPYDLSNYDSEPYEMAISAPVDQDYIVINRASKNKNAWCRSNRWFHEDVLKISIENNRLSPLSSSAYENASSRARRPILEFYPNIKLFGSGYTSHSAVTYINSTVTNAMTEVNGKTSFIIDGIDTLYDGCTVIFSSDPNNKNKVLTVRFVSTTGNNKVISLTEDLDSTILPFQQVVVTAGTNFKGKSFYYDGLNWRFAQEKTLINQPPKFDIFDGNGISFSDQDFYQGSDFTGCTLLEYETVAGGVNDPILGFPIKYTNVNNLGDISFKITLNNQTFSYVDNGISTTGYVNDGYVHSYTDVTTYNRYIGWQTAVEESFQYQVFSFTVTDTLVTFECDVRALTEDETLWKPIVVYIDNARATPDKYTVTLTEDKTIITLNDQYSFGLKVTVMVYSNQISKTGYYQIPQTLDHNPFNGELNTVSFGDIKGHYKTICNNIRTLEGEPFGSNNFRDLGNLVPYGTRIIQNSAPLYPTATFFRDKTLNILDSLDFNGREYIKFKALLVDTVDRIDFNVLQDDASILDTALEEISSTKSQDGSFFWSDMLPSKNPTITKTYTFKLGLDTTVFPLSRVYDFDSANYYGVLVYLTRKVGNNYKTVQLLKTSDYEVSSTDPKVTVFTDLQNNDIITVKEYYQTYGSYVPNTPSKLGFYPSYNPEIIYDNTYVNPTYFIKGHDGSYNKLYGEYVDGYLADFRDRALFEFEKRIYNNIKVKAKVPVEYDDIFPGQFRKTDYSYDDLMVTYTTNFLNWVGLNRIDFATQEYNEIKEYTYNFTGSSTVLNSVVKQGNYRGLYMWLYDTATPNLTPWEMLGFGSKPTWWDKRYGEMPYTRDNKLLWEDLRDGYVWNDGNPYYNKKRARPDLLKVIPVDNKGNLVTPINNIIVGYDYNRFENNWIIGDIGPAEYSYRKSSTWPFDLLKMLALNQPGKFFALGINLDTYRYNTEFNQYLVNDRFRVTQKDFVLYGKNETTATHSYVNWLVDYCRTFGIDGSTELGDKINNLDVRLTYRIAGFSDKDMLKFFLEKGSPESMYSSLLIPDENYQILLHENEPVENIQFSSVIIQKTTNGFKVYGNSQTKTYFTISVPNVNGLYTDLTVNNNTVKLYQSYTTQTEQIPYGYEFFSAQSLGNFLTSYGNYLEQQGMLFDNIENGIQLTWSQMVAEVLYWIQTGWEVGSTVNVNPSAKQISVQKENLLVQPLTLAQENYVLDQNLVPINLKNLSVYRKDNLFRIEALNENDALSFFIGKLNNIEHVVVFDNKTSFNDLIFNTVTGLRQQRVFVKGTKTSEWDGTINAAGFILNQDNIQEWVPNKKYTKGVIVKYKNKYYISQTIIQPSNTFDENDWLKTDYEKIQKGLLPNASNRAYESTLYYNINSANLENDGDLLGFSLIGYRPRTYLSSSDLDDITQVNVYKNMLPAKGTYSASLGLNNLQVQQNTINYDLYENWAIKTNEFGGILNQNFIEFTLDQSKLTGNPSIVGLTVNESIDGVEQEVPLYKLQNYGRSISDANVLPTVSDYETKLPNAGYVNVNDVRATSYYFNTLPSTVINDIYKGEYIWIADKVGTWGIYSMEITSNTVTKFFNNLNGFAIFTFSNPHLLSETDSFGVLNFSSDLDGFYVVESVIDLYNVVVTFDATSPAKLDGKGLFFTFLNHRVATARDIAELPIVKNEFQTFKAWVDENTQSKWTVYERKSRYKESSFVSVGSTNTLGTGLAYIPNVGYFVADEGDNKLYRYVKINNSFFKSETITPPVTTVKYGSKLVHNDRFVIVSDANPNATTLQPSYIFIYKIVNTPNVQTITLEQTFSSSAQIATAIAISGDSQYLYFNIPVAGAVAPFQLDADYKYQEVRYFTNTYYTLFQNTVIDTDYIVISGDRTSTYPVGSYLALDTGSTGDTGEKSYKVTQSEYNTTTGTTTITLDSTLNSYGTTLTRAYVVVPMVLSSATTVGATSITVSGNWLSYINQGKSICFDNQGDETVYTVITGKYDSATNITTWYLEEPIMYTYPSGTKIYTASYNFSFQYVSINPNIFALLEDIENGANYFLVEGNQISYFVAGNYISFTGYGGTYAISSRAYDSIKGYTRVVVSTNILYTVPAGTLVNGGGLTPEFLALDTNSPQYKFGYSIATNNDGSKLFVGAPGQDYSTSILDTGAVYCLDRLVMNWEAQYDTKAGEFFTVVTPFINPYLTATTIVSINGKRLKPNEYVIFLNRVLIGPEVKAGDIITLNTGNFSTVAIYTSYESESQVRAGEMFGLSLDCNDTGSELLVGSPYDEHSTLGQGAVYRFTNEGKAYGFITALLPVSSSTITTNTYIMLNGFLVQILAGSDAAAIANRINEYNLTNILAYATFDDRLVIRLRENSLGKANDKLNITVFSGTMLTSLGIAEYIKTQVITESHTNKKGKFGYAVKFNKQGSFAVSAPNITRYEHTRFDYSSDENYHNDTVFDNNYTMFVDETDKVGSVYIYDYIKTKNESLTNAGQFLYAQSCNQFGALINVVQNYGTVLEFNDYVLMIGDPNYNYGSVKGNVAVFENTDRQQNWTAYREQPDVVDVSKIQSVQLYDNRTNEFIQSLDYFDPLQGKLLGTVRENIDFISSYDPAGYNSTTADKGNIVWGKENVGTIWWDTSTAKFVDYHQGDVVYDSKYWGNLFPGSVISVYTWIVSDVLPSEYTGTGVVLDETKYSYAFDLDANNIAIPRYYYWVKNTNVLYYNKNKSLSDSNIANYIANPLLSGISYFSPLSASVFGLYNIQNNINNRFTNIHIGFNSGTNNNVSNQSFKLIRANYATDFIPGLPETNTDYPTGLYDKLVDSLSGIEERGANVPDPYLPKLLQTGISVRPVQSMFTNRLTAVKNYIEYANNILKDYPILEDSNATFLSYSDDYVNVTKYWKPIYWYASGYSTSLRTAFEVPLYSDLLTVSPTEGLIVGVLNNGQGKREIYTYKNSTWERIGLQDGTIEFSDKLYDYKTNKIGFGDSYYDSTGYDESPMVETRYIVRALNEQIYKGSLLEHRNKSLILLFNFIQSENIENNNYMPWLNKTSLVDVNYTVRNLETYEKYREDNQTLLQGYIDEIKPYHVVIKEFSLGYSGLDAYSAGYTDFDLPARYNDTIFKFVSPQLVYDYADNQTKFLPTASIWQDTDYKPWFDFYGLNLEDTPNEIVAIVNRFVSVTDNKIYLNNAKGLPTQGIITIGNERIAYGSINRDKNILLEVSRGIDSTTPVEHSVGENVYAVLPGVSVLYSGRDYINVPNVIAYVDTTKYPAPRKDAKLKAIVTNQQVIGVEIVDPGSGYVTEPTIVIDYSSKTTFENNNINFQINTISLGNYDLVEGELVKLDYNGEFGAIPKGYYFVHIIDKSETFTIISLHLSKEDAVNDTHRVNFYSSNTNNDYVYTLGITALAKTNLAGNKIRALNETLRFDRTSYQTKLTNWEPGEFYSSRYTSLGNDASSDQFLYYGLPYTITLPKPVNGTSAVVKIFNVLLGQNYAVQTVSPGYGYQVGNTFTIPGTQLGGTSPANDCVITVTLVAGSTLGVTATGVGADAWLASRQGVLMPVISASQDTNSNTIVTLNFGLSGIKVGQLKGMRVFFYHKKEPYRYDDSLAGGAIIDIYEPRFNPTEVRNQYTIKIIDPGTIYNENDIITIPGNLLGGVTGRNDCVITIQYTNGAGGIYISSVFGIANINYATYYFLPNTSDTVRIYKDPGLLIPVPRSEFTFDSLTYTDYAYCPEPLVAGIGYKYDISSMVVYNGNVYRCINSNNDGEFVPTNWELVNSDDRNLNALDRVFAYYQPTYDMPGKDFKQLMSGVTYPLTVYKGNPFSPEDQFDVDIVLKDNEYYPPNLQIKDLVFDGTKLIAIGETNEESYVLYSDDSGDDWSFKVLSSTPLGLTGIAYNDGIYLITSENKLTPVFLSIDGMRWITVGDFTPYDSTNYEILGFDTSALSCPNVSLQKPVFVNGNSYLVGSDTIAKESSIINWQAIYSTGTRLSNIIYDLANVNITNYVGLIAVGEVEKVVSGQGTAYPDVILNGQILLSTDYLTWNQLPGMLTQYSLNTITASNDIIVVAGNNGTLLYSFNGSNYVNCTVNTPVTNNLNAVVYDNGMFIVVGDNGTILKSVDGVNFTKITVSSTVNLLNVYYSGTYFFAAGQTDSLLRSIDGVNWYKVGNITNTEPDYNIQGSDYQFGYGPEELVAGVTTDNLSMKVITAPGTFWDNDTSQDFYFGYTGFGMKSVVKKPDSNLKVSFAGLLLNPTTLSVFILDDATQKGYRIYEQTSTNNSLMYSINWKEKTIALSGSISSNESVMVEVYSPGNGRFITRANNDFIPLRINPLTGNSCIDLDVQYITTSIDPIVYVNGSKLEYNVDYYLDYTPENLFRISFNTVYNQETDYIVFGILEDTVSDLNSNSYTYGLPETEVFSITGDTIVTTLDLTNVDPNTIIVEVNGLRLVPPPLSGYDYTVDVSTNTITLVSSVSTDDLVAVTSFNDTQRQWISTGFNQTLFNNKVTYVYNTLPAKIVVEYINSLYKYSDSDLVTIDGVKGAIGINNKSFYVKDVTDYTPVNPIYTYELYSDVGLYNPVNGNTFGTFTDIGYVWEESGTFVAPQPSNVPTEMPSIMYTDSERTWAVLDGYRVNPSITKFNQANRLSIFTPTTAGQYFVVSSYVSGSTPNEQRLSLSVNKQGISSVYNFNLDRSTWLTQDVISTSTSLTFNNVRKLVNVVDQNYTVETSDGETVVYLNCDFNSVVKTEVYNVSTLSAVTDYAFVQFNDRPTIIFNSGATAGNTVTVTLVTGKVVEIGQERIRFESIDFITNTISEITRGISGTPTTNHYIYDYAFGVNESTKMKSEYLPESWGSKLSYSQFTTVTAIGPTLLAYLKGTYVNMQSCTVYNVTQNRELLSSEYSLEKYLASEPIINCISGINVGDVLAVTILTKLEAPLQIATTDAAKFLKGM